MLSRPLRLLVSLFAVAFLSAWSMGVAFYNGPIKLDTKSGHLKLH